MPLVTILIFYGLFKRRIILNQQQVRNQTTHLGLISRFVNSANPINGSYRYLRYRKDIFNLILERKFSNSV